MELTEKQYRKYKGKPVAELLQIAQDVFNAFIRSRDSDEDYFTCISCREPKHIGYMNAGHYLPVSVASSIRFHEDNCHGQCIECNQGKDGNRSAYYPALVLKIGIDRVTCLEMLGRQSKKWDRHDLAVIIETYKSKLKQQ